ncbi:phosphoribosylglycinamide formyltransferase [Fusobacterium nucleatum subsp. nucleatum ATCC 23726]|uniref:phosphoribosylglycinamide formyltransferase 1 n=1 Tax=Fusobacterium nucleatum subsp. nucleatum (strain ATCC 23726 / VPI 4351) TaxID=525283 RepID=D5RFG8_FUSN2|nr:formyltransferase family protein [Fusobacterium nucleatum]AVQ22382.1 phosphoribosylglycinamide formyltransferase [Fusobacterium nucleatum subsp. nucleatum ATCC 23726]EFG94432.1 formyl transferase [Fusobacterium nucleatum subsp. nucleatum ATCC 23726]
MLIGVLTYNIPHRKTYDTLCLLKARGYKDVIVFATPLHYKKQFKPLYEHRPQLINQISSIKDFCNNLDYKYELIDNFLDIDLKENTKILVCGAGILPDNFIKKYKVINSHPGYIPEVRGLDSLKWAIILEKKIGVTTHLIGDEVDAGYIIEQKEVPIYENDTFHALSQRVYETEICMLVDAIEKSDRNLIYKNGKNTEVHTRMSKEIEKDLLKKFEELKI